jgi:cell division septal protein FtsQ
MAVLRGKKPPSFVAPRRVGERLRSLAILSVVGVLVFVLAAAIGALGWQFYLFLFRTNYFAIENIRVTNADKIVTQQVLWRLRADKLTEGNLLQVSSRQIRQAVESLPKVRSAKVEKIPPCEIRIDVEQRQPVALLCHDPLLTLDRDGVVLDTLSLRRREVLDYPFITGVEAGRVRLGDRLRSADLTKALGFISCLRGRAGWLFDRVSELHCGQDGQLTVLLKGGTEIRFGEGIPTDKMPLLETFVGKKGMPEKYAYIDLRFDGQISSMSKEESARRVGLRVP